MSMMILSHLRSSDSLHGKTFLLSSFLRRDVKDDGYFSECNSPSNVPYGFNKLELRFNYTGDEYSKAVDMECIQCENFECDSSSTSSHLTGGDVQKEISGDGNCLSLTESPFDSTGTHGDATKTIKEQIQPEDDLTIGNSSTSKNYVRVMRYARPNSRPCKEKAAEFRYRIYSGVKCHGHIELPNQPNSFQCDRDDEELKLIDNDVEQGDIEDHANISSDKKSFENPRKNQEDDEVSTKSFTRKVHQNKVEQEVDSADLVNSSPNKESFEDRFTYPIDDQEEIEISTSFLSRKVFEVKVEQEEQASVRVLENEVKELHMSFFCRKQLTVKVKEHREGLISDISNILSSGKQGDIKSQMRNLESGLCTIRKTEATSCVYMKLQKSSVESLENEEAMKPLQKHVGLQHHIEVTHRDVATQFPLQVDVGAQYCSENKHKTDREVSTVECVSSAPVLLQSCIDIQYCPYDKLTENEHDGEFKGSTANEFPDQTSGELEHSHCALNDNVQLTAYTHPTSCNESINLQRSIRLSDVKISNHDEKSIIGSCCIDDVLNKTAILVCDIDEEEKKVPVEKAEIVAEQDQRFDTTNTPHMIKHHSQVERYPKIFYGSFC